MKIFTFIAISVAAIQVFANSGVVQLAGDWIATSGKASSNIGISANCTKVSIKITQDDKGIVTQNYHADCGTLGSDWGPVAEDFSNGKVFEKGEEVGTVDATTMLTTSADSGVQYAYNLQIKKDANGNDVLRSYYGAKNAVGALVIEAELTRSK